MNLRYLTAIGYRQQFKYRDSPAFSKKKKNPRSIVNAGSRHVKLLKIMNLPIEIEK